MLTIKNSNWLELHFEPSDLILKAKIRDETVEVTMSPYDVPDRIKLVKLVEAGWYAIRLSYISNEEKKTEYSVTPLIKYLSGNSSGRVYKITFNESVLVGADLNTKRPWAEVDHMMRQIVDKLRDGKKEPSYELVRKAVERSMDKFATV